MTEPHDYLDYSDQPNQLTGGIRRIPIKTARGEFSIWTRRVSNNPKIRLLLLHGGPEAHAMDGRPGPARALPALPQWQPFMPIRRPTAFFPWPGALPERRR